MHISKFPVVMKTKKINEGELMIFMKKLLQFYFTYNYR